MKTQEPLGEGLVPLAGAWPGASLGEQAARKGGWKESADPCLQPPQAWELLGALSWAGISPAGLKHPSAAWAGESRPAGPVGSRCRWRQRGPPALLCGPLSW